MTMSSMSMNVKLQIKGVEIELTMDELRELAALVSGGVGQTYVNGVRPPVYRTASEGLLTTDSERLVTSGDLLYRSGGPVIRLSVVEP